VNVVRAVGAHADYLSRVVPGLAAVPSLDLGAFTDPVTICVRFVTSTAPRSAASAALGDLDEITPHSKLLLAIIVGDVISAVGAHTRDLSRIVLGLTTVARLDLGTFFKLLVFSISASTSWT